MKRFLRQARQALRALATAVGMLALPLAHAEGTYARHGLRFYMQCLDERPPAVNLVREGAKISIKCRNLTEADGQILIGLYVESGSVFSAELLGEDREWRPEEVSWSPDPGVFAVSGSSNAYAGRDVVVFRLVAGKLIRTEVLLPARKQMIARLAECWPEVRTAYSSPRLDELNMSAIAWRDTNTLVVFGEVTPSSSYGNAMGQAMGFEIDARDGKVLREMTAEEFKAKWQSRAGWSIRIPDKAECGRLYPEDRAREAKPR